MSRGPRSQLDMTWHREYAMEPVPDWLLVGGYADGIGCERAELYWEDVAMPE